MECTFCKKTYSTNSSLLHHQRTAKVCLKIQLENGINNKQLFECTFCKKHLTTKYNLDNHLSICKEKIKKDTIKVTSEEIIKKTIEEKEEIKVSFKNKQEELEYELKLKDRKIKELEERLEKREKSPKIINKNKNITNNINILTINEVMTPERVEEFFKKHYNLQTLMEGIPGLAKFICDGFIREKANYICTDRSRHKFVMKDAQGNSVEDTNCENLVSLTAPGMTHIKDVYETGLFSTEDETEKIHAQYKPISDLDKDTGPFRVELSKIVPCDTQPQLEKPKDDWRKQFEMMRESYERNRKYDP
jgi:hypothetical protein